MTGLEIILVALALVSLVVVVPMRRAALQRGTGPLAQIEFKRRHGDELVRLLGAGAAVETQRRSPWTNIEFAGRPARIVVARLPQGRLQAGVDLSSFRIPVDIWYTDGSPHELDVPETIDLPTVLELVAQLHELGVDNLASTTGRPFQHHLMRVQFDELAELPACFDRIAPVIAQLEALAPADATPHLAEGATPS